MIKNISVVFIVLSLIAVSVFALVSTRHTNAGAGYNRIYKPTLSATSAPADGVSTIVLKVWVTNDWSDYTTEELGVPMGAQITGGATISPDRVGGPGSSGTGTFTIRSSVPGEKTITIISDPNGGPEVPVLSVKVTFTDPRAVHAPAAPSTSSNKQSAAPPKRATPSNSPSATTATNVATQQTPPAVSDVSFNNQKHDPSTPDKLPEFTKTESFELKGKTTPNVDVTVYVFSEPKMFKTRSDSSGNWSVSVSGLPSGKHHAELEVTDPASGVVSPRVHLGEFNVLPDAVAEAVARTAGASESKGAPLMLVVGSISVLLLAVISIVTLFILRKRRNKSPL